VPFNDPHLLQQIFESVIAGALGLIGAIANFFYDVDKGNRSFSFKGMFFASVVGFVVGTAAGSFIPAGENFYGWTVVIGMNAYPLMAAMKDRSGAMLDRFFKR